MNRSHLFFLTLWLFKATAFAQEKDSATPLAYRKLDSSKLANAIVMLKDDTIRLRKEKQKKPLNFFWKKPNDDSTPIPNAYNRKNWNLELKKDSANLKTAESYDLLDREYAQGTRIKSTKPFVNPEIKLTKPNDLLDRKFTEEKKKEKTDSLKIPVPLK